MSDALTVTQPLVHLVARNPVEMQEARSGLAEWLKAKIAEVDAEMGDYQRSFEEAVKNKWGAKGLKKATSSAFYRKEFYEKTLAAVDAGFTVVPEFPVDVFAIRVQRDAPEGGVNHSRYGRAAADQERCEILPAGAGYYVSPSPKTYHWKETRADDQGKEYKVDLVKPTKLQPVEFPLRSARAEVMSATAEAMALQVFDEIGICPQTRKADPLIIGRILLPDSDRAVSFLIAWHLNLNEL
jgi:hypothetical protein